MFDLRTATGSSAIRRRHRGRPAFLLAMLETDPANPGVPDTPFAAVNPRGKPVSFRLVFADAQRSALLLDLGPQPGRGEYAVYDHPKSNATGRIPKAGLQDPRPVALAGFGARGKSAPDTWRRLRFLYSRAGHARETKRVESTDGLVAPGEKARMLEARTIILCPRAGRYRFALGSATAAGLEVDGNLRASAFDPYNGHDWSTGGFVHLEAGLHKLRVLAWAAHGRRLRIGWRPPGASRVTLIPRENLVTADAVEVYRVERIDRTLHADFSYDVRPAYSFFGDHPVFVPVLLRNQTRDWLPRSMTCGWRFGSLTRSGGEPISGNETTRTFVGLTEHWAELTARDDLGFVASRRKIIDCSAATPKMYTLGAQLALDGAAYYPGDHMQPVIRTSGKAPVNLAFALDCRVTAMDGTESHLTRDIRLGKTPSFLHIPGMRAGEVRALQWSVLHEGVGLRGETIHFRAPPLGMPPVRLAADRLYDAQGDRVVLVAADASRARRQARITTEQAFGNITCVDDFLLAGSPRQVDAAEGFDRVLARLVDGPDHPQVRYVPLPDWEASAEGFGPLLKLLAVPEAIATGTDVLILSIGLRDALRIGDARAFEREIAALADIVASGRNAPAIVWVTPPAYPDLEDALRPFALAIRRVAAARDMPVADCFTASRGTRQTRSRLFLRDALSLSREGQELAARIIARALLLDAP